MKMLAELFGLFAVSAGPPPDLSLDDPDVWRQKGRILLEGPQDACVEVQGTARLEAVVFTPGSVLGEPEQIPLGIGGTFEGTLDKGTWTRLEATLEHDDPDSNWKIDDPKIRPITGKSKPVDRERSRDKPSDDPEGEGNSEVEISVEGDRVALGASQSGTDAVNMIDEVLDRIDPDVTYAWAQWDPTREGVVLEETIPLDDSRRPAEAKLETLFPGGGPPSELHLTFPERLKIGDWPKRITVMNAQLHITAQQTPMGVLPAVESLSLVAGAFGFTFGFEQELRYLRARPCRGGE